MVAQGTNEHGRAVCKVISRRMAGGGASACVVLVRWDSGGAVGEGAGAGRITGISAYFGYINYRCILSSPKTDEDVTST